MTRRLPLFCLAAIGLTAAPAAAADFDPVEAVAQAVRDCTAFVEGRSTAIFPEAPDEVNGDRIYLHAEARTAEGLTLEYQHVAFDTSRGTELPDTWSCRIEGTRPSRLIWRAAGIPDLFADMGSVLPDLVADDVETTRWSYAGCADPTAPIDHSYALSDRGHLTVSIQAPALDPLACQGVTNLSDLLFACVYEFAREPWDQIRAETGAGPEGQFTLHHRGTLEDLTGLPDGDPDKWRTITAQTEYGLVTIARLGEGTGRCVVEGTSNTPGLAGARHADFAAASNDFLTSAITFYDGVFFRTEAGSAPALLTCADSFPHTAIFPTTIPQDGADPKLAMIFETTDAPAFVELCGERQ